MKIFLTLVILIISVLCLFKDKQSDARFYALCEEKFPLKSHGPTGWCSPKRSTLDSAKIDLEAHDETFSHKSTICVNECPTCN